MAVRPPPFQEILAEMAARALETHDGDLIEARRCLKRQILQDQSLLSLLLDQVVWEAVDNCVRTSHRKENARRFDHAVRVQEQRTSEASALRVLLLDVVLGTGVRLRVATRPQVSAEAAFQGKQARTMSMKAAFFEQIAGRLPDDVTTVETVLTEAQLRDLFATIRVQHAA